MAELNEIRFKKVSEILKQADLRKMTIVALYSIAILDQRLEDLEERLNIVESLLKIGRKEDEDH